MAAKKKQSQEKDAGASGSTRSMRDDTEKELARSPVIAPDLAGQTAEELIDELRVHQIELEMQAEDLRRVQLALEESRDKYLDLYEFAPIGYLTLTDKALITDVNLTGATLLGVERSTLIRAPLSKFITEKDADQWHRYFVNVRQQDHQQTCTLTLIRGDNSVFPARLESIRLTGSSGGTTTVRMAISDITDISRAEEALIRSENRYRTLAESSPDNIFIIGRDDTVQFVNLHAAGSLQLPVDNIIGKPRKNVFSHDIADTQGADLRKVFETGEPFRNEHKIQYGNQEIWQDNSLIPLKDETGNVTAVLGVARDITERKRAVESLKEREEKYRSYIDNAPNGVFIVNEDGYYIEVNPAACTITGYSKKELLQMRIPDLLPPESYEVAAEHFQRAVKTGHASGEFVFRHKDGSLRYWSVDAVKLSSTRFLGFVQDITDRKQAEEQLKQTVDELKRFNNLTVDRELRMIELKKEINALLKKSGEEEKYRIGT